MLSTIILIIMGIFLLCVTIVTRAGAFWLLVLYGVLYFGYNKVNENKAENIKIEQQKEDKMNIISSIINDPMIKNNNEVNKKYENYLNKSGISYAVKKGSDEKDYLMITFYDYSKNDCYNYAKTFNNEGSLNEIIINNVLLKPFNKSEDETISLLNAAIPDNINKVCYKDKNKLIFVKYL